MTVELRDISSFLYTDPNHKLSLREPGEALSAQPQGNRALVGINESDQVGDRTSTVVLSNNIPNNVDDSCYRGKPCSFENNTLVTFYSITKCNVSCRYVSNIMVQRKLSHQFSFYS